MKKNIYTALSILLICNIISGQNNNNRFKDGLKVYLTHDSTTYLKATGLIQVWARNNWNNPGSTVFGYDQNQTTDFGIRRMRFQLYGPIAKHVFVYTQFGINNFNYLAPRKQGAFFHDAVTEYEMLPRYLSIGAGLNSWTGPSRFSAPSVGTIMGVDAPIYQQVTNDQTDQFVRKLGVYVKGKISKLDYRFGISKPFPVQTQVPTQGGVAFAVDTTISANSKFSPLPPKLQYQTYIKWHFLDEESNETPYNVGTYLGKKRVLTLGAGFTYQKEAMRYLITTGSNAGYTDYHDLLLASVDLFYDSYLDKEKGNAINFYASYSYYDYGQNYLRTNGVMNVATGSSNTNVKALNGFGNAFAMYGSGNVEYFQLGYKFKNNLLGSRGTLMPYISSQISQYQALKYHNMVMAEAGINWILSGNNKITLNYQSRPVFQTMGNGDIKDIESARRGMLYLQYQVSF